MKLLLTILLTLTICSGAWAGVHTAEICGDGYDNATSGYTYGACPVGWMNAVWQGTGCDKECPGSDKDNDGYDDSVDCGPTDKKMFAGMISDSGCGANTFKTCQSDGTFTSCGNLHSGSGATYLIDPSTGNDANVGSIASPWATYGPLDNTALAGYHALVAGDVVLIKTNGSITYTYDVDAGAPVNLEGFRIRLKDGTLANPIKIFAYPGYSPKIAPSGCSSSDVCPGIYVENSDYVQIRGLEVQSSFGIGISGADQTGFLIEGNEIHDNDCIEDDNCSGVSAKDSTDLTVSRNDIYDNFERGAPSGGSDINDTQIVIFSILGTRKIEYNNMWVTAAVDSTNSKSGGFKDKHGSNSGTLSVKGNMLLRASQVSIHIQSVNATVEKNRLINSSAITNRELGGPMYMGNDIYQDNITISNNTDRVNGFNFFVMRTTGLYAVPSCGTNPLVTVRRNIFQTTRASGNYYGDDADIELDHYGADADYTLYYNTNCISFTSNCYYNPSLDYTASTNFITAWGSTSGAQTLGSKKTLTTFKSDGFEVGGFQENPALDSNFLPTSSNCLTFGQVYSSGGGGGGGSASARKGQQNGSGRKGQK